MKKCILAVVMAAVAMLTVQAVTHAKVQLWEGGPYWATTNIGAEKPEDYGLYFWWGDTTGHRPSGTTFSFNFSSSNTPTYKKTLATLQSEGWVVSQNGTYVLAPAHDAAHVHWGGSWRMPMYQELYDLCFNKCDWTWTSQNGVNGFIVRGRGDFAANSIFLPAAGSGYGSSLFNAGSGGDYWLSVPYSDSGNAWALHFDSSGHSTYRTYRSLGFSVRPVQGFGEGAPTDCVVHFNANGGTGNMDEQTFEEGNEQKLSKNTYRKDGYVFQGWAVAANGEVVYKDEALITVDSDMTLYAVWANPPLTLTAESADWSLGSITLRCEDSDTSGTEHTYSLMYYEDVEAEKRWYGIDGAQLVKATAEVDAEGNDVLVARLIDARFAKRMDGIHTVKYRVMDENGRVAECVTRNRHGLFVAVDEYENGWLEAHANHAHQVSVFRGAYLKYGDADGYMPRVLNGSNASRDAILIQLKYIAENVAIPGDIVVFYYVGHGTDGSLSCYNSNATISAAELYESFTKFPNGTGVVALIDSCHSATMINRGDMDGNGMGNIAWIVAAQANETTYCGAFKALVCDRGWFNGEADVYGGNVFADNNGYVTFGELAAWGQQVMGDRNNYTSGNAYPFRPEDYGHMTSHYNSLVLENIVAGRVPPQTKTSRIWTWLTSFPTLFATSGGDETAVVNTTAANGCRTVGECYELGIDPEDPDDDLKIAGFKMKDGKPEITLNHTKDGSGNSFEDRVKILGKAELTDAEWQEVPPEGNPAHRFFKVGVEMP